VSTIQVLPPAVADQIAAGEVVERPASVVKELVENALDAGATGIEVTVQDGGRTLIRVSDDGCGMDRTDAAIALARHGTSKIRTAADLTGVRTYGFRGEALPAIASVAQLELETAPEDGSGTRVRAAGGTPAELTGVARRRGTSVSVSNLFAHVPARLKFLRGARSEWRAILDALTTVALTRPELRLRASHDGRVVLDLAPAATLYARVGALWGVRYAEGLLPVDDVSGAVRVTGLVERPASVGTAGRRVFLSVNGRPVRDVGMVRAAESAYRSTIPAGARPSLMLALTLPAEAVDVNVHPSKAEVRFHDRWPVERAVERAVRRALGTLDAAASVGAHGAPWRWERAGGGAQGGEPADTDALLPGAPADGPLFARPGSAAGPGTAEREPADESRTVDAELPPLTQLRRTYIMLEHEEGLVLVDQHSAHERVLFERFLAVLAAGSGSAQHLLLPLTLTITAAEYEAYEGHRDVLDRLGFAAEAFGGTSLIVHAVPSPHPRFDAARCLRETLASLAGDRVAGSASRHEHLVATLACKAAVRAGDPLSQSEMRALILALRDTELPAHDVHGRATIVRLPWAEVDRRFGRV